jgi:hypothetical protein
MLALPKVNKGVRRALTSMERVQRAIAGVALVLGVALAGMPATDAQAAPATQNAQQSGGSLLLAAPGQTSHLLADHYSHGSHSSHASHSSHHSHYSSNYQ